MQMRRCTICGREYFRRRWYCGYQKCGAAFVFHKNAKPSPEINTPLRSRGGARRRRCGVPTREARRDFLGSLRWLRAKQERVALRGLPDDPSPRSGDELDRDVQDRLWAAIWLEDLKKDPRLRALRREDLRRELESGGFSERVIVLVLLRRFPSYN